MEKQDARSLPGEAQEDLRRRVVEAVQKGLSQTEAARVFGVARGTVSRWMGTGGTRRTPGAESTASRTTSGFAIGAASSSHDGAPHSERLPGPVELALCAVDQGSGARVAVAKVRSAGFGVDGGTLFASLGSDPAEAGATSVRTKSGRGTEMAGGRISMRFENRRDSVKAQIHWLDEMGLRSDHQAGRSYGRRGQTPVVLGTGQRFRCNMISAITNRGRLAFMIFRQRFTARVFLNFLGRLLRLTRKTRRKVFLIVDGHPVHKSRSVSRWLAEHSEQIRIFCLPSYSPELNPDELLNQDVKTNALGRVRPVNVQEMMDNVRSYLRITQARPKLVKNYFRERHVQYAAR